MDEYRANHTDSLEGFIERVDAWLYQAKHLGQRGGRVMHPDLVFDVVVATNVTPDKRRIV